MGGEWTTPVASRCLSVRTCGWDTYLQWRQKACQEWDDKGVVDSSGKKVKRKQATLKTRKSIGSGKRGGESDGDDDFMPTKKAAAAKARKPIAPAAGASRARPKAAKGGDSDDEMSLDEEEDEAPAARPQKKRAAPATKPKPPPPAAASDSDFDMVDMDEDPQPPAQPKKASATKDDDDDDEDSGDDLVRRALEKGKGKATQQASKRKS